MNMNEESASLSTEDRRGSDHSNRLVAPTAVHPKEKSHSRRSRNKSPKNKRSASPKMPTPPPPPTDQDGSRAGSCQSEDRHVPKRNSSNSRRRKERSNGMGRKHGSTGDIWDQDNNNNNADMDNSNSNFSWSQHRPMPKRNSIVSVDNGSIPGSIQFVAGGIPQGHFPIQQQQRRGSYNVHEEPVDDHSSVPNRSHRSHRSSVLDFEEESMGGGGAGPHHHGMPPFVGPNSAELIQQTLQQAHHQQQRRLRKEGY